MANVDQKSGRRELCRAITSSGRLFFVVVVFADERVSWLGRDQDLAR